MPQSPRHHLGNFLPLQLRDGGEQAQVQLSLYMKNGQKAQVSHEGSR